jgi:hypothetical protein
MFPTCMTPLALMAIGATSAGGVTALVVQTRRAKNAARATDPTIHTSTLTQSIDRRRSDADRTAAGTPVAPAARRRVDVRMTLTRVRGWRTTQLSRSKFYQDLPTTMIVMYTV